MKARWFTLKDFPYEVQFYDTKAKKGGTRTEYRQDGYAWQAEEVFKDGKWQRYTDSPVICTRQGSAEQMGSLRQTPAGPS